MRRTKVRLPFLFLLVMPVLPSNGVSVTVPRRFLPDQVWATNGRLNQVRVDQFSPYTGEKRNLEWGEWLFIVERQ
ncbi:hypothetical protein [Spirosoma endophyticum]|uniref:Uncharacterized protein n=1 Tax=Spirosoma endophyticum TaxID=662367 RepID=A0A1I1LLM6_9BACT|nr:hypothetical protein [Spirosoma endophyticum]SFC71213.1 hypothetical protein SAMN05216167_102210 [Spirosoma endophyticum]